MTQKQAVRLEKRVLTVGSKAFKSAADFRIEIRRFRSSGAWAVTPQHHKNFAEWCAWAAPKIGFNKNTLKAYSYGAYEQHLKRMRSQDKLSVFGDAATWLKKAIDAAHKNGVKEHRHWFYVKAIIEISKWYLETA